MDNKNQESLQPMSSLLNSLNLHTSSILTSTKNLGPPWINSLNVNRRKAIIPTPNRPTITSQSIAMNNNDDELTFEQKHVVTRSQSRFGNKQVEIMDSIDDLSQPEQIEDEQRFDSFIMEHFIPFSGKQNGIHWLDETEKKFTQLQISRKLRFEAVSLLVEGNANCIYIKNRKEIQSFDDFYEFLLTHFDPNDSSLSQSKGRGRIRSQIGPFLNFN